MKITVIGAGKSGLAAAKLAKRMNFDVFLSELKSGEFFPGIDKVLSENNISYEFGKNSQESLTNSELVVVSPGIPPSAEILVEAERKNIPIISEIEFAYRYCKNPIIAITGTNGKTTTTALTEFIFNNSGRKAIACGNIGLPFSDVVDNVSDDTVLILELSSYQLDRIKSFKPEVAIILNLTPDHQKYHGSIEKYYSAKFKISLQQNEKNLLILNSDDCEIQNRISKHWNGSVPISFFSSGNGVDWGIYIKDGKIVFKEKNSNKEEVLMLANELSLPGVHNAQNSLAAALAARAFEIKNENIRDSLMRFTGVEHRLEFVRSINGIEFINDSKATNINATWYALTSYQKPLVWIAGGLGESNDYSLLDDIVKNNVKAIIAIGDEADAIFNHYCTSVRCVKAISMENAVGLAFAVADDDEIVLFSPACKSFDMFDNFEHRGQVFKQLVNELIEY